MSWIASDLFHSGCDEPRNATLPFRIRLLRALGKQGSPAHCWVHHRTTGFVPKGVKPLGDFFCTRQAESQMYEFVCDTKTNSGHRQPEKPDVPAGLRQRVGARNKDKPARGYSVATGINALFYQALFLVGLRGRLCLRSVQNQRGSGPCI